ncbi:MAG: hypothetical protein HC866_06080 [Leptolyngbyaceae cyanobacterium RU_5_1]|nr:hypothetical protein [Leptolyngbyaceae cyanobacterium RU_5_1]
MNQFKESKFERLFPAYHFKSRLTRCVVGVSILSGLVFGALPVTPAIAASDSRTDFRECASDLIKAQIPNEEAIAACSRVLEPEDLSKCVRRVSRDGTYTGIDALGACRQVRRPVDMAECVTDIRGTLKDAAAPDVLDNCRRSLLPVRYSDCVVGVSRGASGLSPANALNTCNEALYFPRELDPTFIPYAGTTTEFTPTAPPPTVPEVTAPVAPVPQPTKPAPTDPVRGLY